MLRVFSFSQVSRVIAVLTAMLSTGLYVVLELYADRDYPIFNIVFFAVTVSAILIFIITTEWCARAILGFYLWINPRAFPNLTGTWSGSVNIGGPSSLKIRARILQTLDRLQIDVYGSSMKSVTLEATPAIDRGQLKVYHLYHCTPREPSYPSYYGSTILDVRRIQDGDKFKLALSGRYFTDRYTSGTIELEQQTQDAATDVAYY